MNKRTLLLVAHAPSANTERLASEVVAGASHEDIENVIVKRLSPFATQPDDVRDCSAIILGTTENLGYMSGALKDFFDRCYYPVLEEKQGLPCAVYIRAGHDGTGTQRAITTILTGLKWKQVQDMVIMRGDWQDAFADQARELGLYMAAALDNGII